MKDQMEKKEKMLEELKRKYDGKENSSQSQLADKKFLVEFEMRQKLFEDDQTSFLEYSFIYGLNGHLLCSI